MSSVRPYHGRIVAGHDAIRRAGQGQSPVSSTHLSESMARRMSSSETGSAVRPRRFRTAARSWPSSIRPPLSERAAMVASAAERVARVDAIRAVPRQNPRTEAPRDHMRPPSAQRRMRFTQGWVMAAAQRTDLHAQLVVKVPESQELRPHACAQQDVALGRQRPASRFWSCLLPTGHGNARPWPAPLLLARGSTPTAAHILWNCARNCGSFLMSFLCFSANSSRCERNSSSFLAMCARCSFCVSMPSVRSRLCSASCPQGVSVHTRQRPWLYGSKRRFFRENNTSRCACCSRPAKPGLLLISAAPQHAGRPGPAARRSVLTGPAAPAS